MRKQIFSIIATVGASVLVLLGISQCIFPSNVVYAATDAENGIEIEDEYVIPDEFD